MADEDQKIYDAIKASHLTFAKAVGVNSEQALKKVADRAAAIVQVAESASPNELHKIDAMVVAESINCIDKFAMVH